VKGFGRDVFLALFLPLAFGIAVAAACYATTGPTPTCAADPSQPWCYHPPMGERADAGR
jgi:hypothetical protein